MNNYTLLSQRCQKKDKRAQLEFYQLFYKSVYNSCLRILNNPQEAEEIMQECLLKPLDQPEYLLEDKTEMEKWLKKTAINRSIDLYRKRKIQFVEISTEFDSPEEQEDEEDIVVKLKSIHQLLKQLPTGYRIILTLRLIESWEYKEIAELMKISESTVRSQFTRAKQKLISMTKIYSHENISR